MLTSVKRETVICSFFLEEEFIVVNYVRKSKVASKHRIYKNAFYEIADFRIGEISLYLFF